MKPRISWKHDIDMSNVTRNMSAQEMKEALLSTPANRPYLFDLQKITPIYARKAVGLAKGWYRKPRRYGRRSTPRQSSPAPRTVAQTSGKVTFTIGGCTITVPRGVAVEVTL